MTKHLKSQNDEVILVSQFFYTQARFLTTVSTLRRLLLCHKLQHVVDYPLLATKKWHLRPHDTVILRLQSMMVELSIVVALTTLR